MSVPRFETRHWARGRPLGEIIGDLWVTGCQALAMSAEQAGQSSRELRGVLPSWAGERIGDRPVQPSYVADDGAPFEMSVNWSGSRPELRVLFDCLSDVPSGFTTDGSRGTWDHRSILTVCSDLFQRVGEVFTPRGGRPSVAPLWHSIAWRPPWQMVHKAYFGLYQWPEHERYAAVAEAMRRLGMSTAWDNARRRAEADDDPTAREIEFVGLDLSGSDARVKIYYRTHAATIDELNHLASAASSHDAGRARTAYRILTGHHTDAGTAALTCLAFRRGEPQAAESTTYLRMPAVTGSDQEAVARTSTLLRGENVDTAPFTALATAWAPGPLADSQGLLELVSYRAAGRASDITTYFRFPVFDQPVPVPDPTVELAPTGRRPLP